MSTEPGPGRPPLRLVVVAGVLAAVPLLVALVADLLDPITGPPRPPGGGVRSAPAPVQEVRPAVRRPPLPFPTPVPRSGRGQGRSVISHAAPVRRLPPAWPSR
jgi:hypothetical protein